MLSLLKDWQGSVDVNDVSYESIQKVKNPVSGRVHIVLYPEGFKAQNEATTRSEQVVEPSGEKLITVKKYMTQKAEPGFDFMSKWNNNEPMPMRTMAGVVLQETRGMVRMRLHGTMYAEKMCTCMCCGRPLTNPVSQYFGVGPECGGHNYVNPFDSEAELKEAVAEYRKKLENITWEGWIIRSSIIECKEVDL